MPTERLTTLSAVKEWLSLPASPANEVTDKALIRVINAVSRFVIKTYLNRDGFGPRVYTENFKGNGKAETLLRNWPVLSVSSVGVGNSSILASVPGVAGFPGSGYRLGDQRDAPQSLELFGSHFYYRMPCQVSYRAGYLGREGFTIETDAVSFAPAEYGQWVSDLGVTLNGLPFTKVEETPGPGEYTVSEWGVYTFSAEDDGDDVVVEYGFAPWDVAFAVTEVIGEWYRRKERIGILSKTLGGQETITFSDRDMSGPAAAALQGYRNVIPI